ALWLRCQNPQIQPVLAEPGALPEHKIAAPTAQVIYQQLLNCLFRPDPAGNLMTSGQLAMPSGRSPASRRKDTTNQNNSQAKFDSFRSI
ncbi:MAG: hypothetical protein LBS10_02630, partial [Gracilibacteraceae bacterium]|nr:hypothetical protein [Gracilibacteraceae bacterium]